MISSSTNAQSVPQTVKFDCKSLKKGSSELFVHVWRSFGDGLSESLGVQQMFKSHRARRLDPRALSERNLSAKFASQGMGISFPVACQHDLTGEPRVKDRGGVKQLNSNQGLVGSGKACH